MKRAFLLVWVIVASLGQLHARDQVDLANRQKECQRMSKEFTQHAKELEERAKHLEGDAAKAANELSVLKKEEAENFAELADAIDKKQWSSIKRFEKKGEKLCHEWTEKMESFEKKFGDQPGRLAKDAQEEKTEMAAAKPEWKKESNSEWKDGQSAPEWKKEPKPEPSMKAKSEEPSPEKSNDGLDKINAQAQGLGNP